MWNGFIWFRTWSRCGLLLTLTLIIRVIKRKFMISPTSLGFWTTALLPWFQKSHFRDLHFSRQRKFLLRLMGCDAMWDDVYGPTYNESAFLHFCVWIVTFYSTLKKEAWDFDDMSVAVTTLFPKIQESSLQLVMKSFIFRI